MKTGPCKTFSYITQSECVQSILREQYQLTESALFTTSFLTYNGVTFKPNAFVLLSYDVLLPKIFTILIVNREIFLIMNEYTTQYFDSHYHAYCICEPQYTPSKFHVLTVKNLPYYNIVHIRHSFANDNKLYVSLSSLYQFLLLYLLYIVVVSIL